MQLIPVLDVLGGQVVRGIGGERDRYQANVSQLVSGSDPVETALAFRQFAGVSTIYLADLDALQGGNCAVTTIEALVSTGCSLAVDAGVSTVDEARLLIDRGVEQVVIALETLTNFEFLDRIVENVTPERLVFSLDMKNGVLLGQAARGQQPLQVIRHVLKAGIKNIIVLDLADVGKGHGFQRLDLCRCIKEQSLNVRIWSGGGIRGSDDLPTLASHPLDGILIASALHDGRLTPAQWATFYQEHSTVSRSSRRND